MLSGQRPWRGATAFDMHGFSRVLGPSEANRQLRQHWRAWVTERDLARLASQGINTLRIPVGDWMWEPYEPYVGCTDGARVVPAHSGGVLPESRPSAKPANSAKLNVRSPDVC